MMDGMCIVIPSWGRYEYKYARTLRVLSQQRNLIPTFLVVRDTQLKEYRSTLRDLGLSGKVKMLKVVRPGPVPARNRGLRYVTGQGFKKMVISDDDLTFSSRVSGKLLTQTDITPALEMMYDLMDKYAHTGLTTRMGNCFVKEDYVETTRVHTCVGYRLDILKKEGLKFELTGREGMHMTLRVMERGYPNAVIYKHAINSHGKTWVVEDGNELYLFSKKTALRLKRKHPHCVTVTERDYKLGKRVEVRIAWKKALKQPAIYLDS